MAGMGDESDDTGHAPPPLAGHGLLVWRQTKLVEGLSKQLFEIPTSVYGCECGAGPVTDGLPDMWFLGHCISALGADLGLRGRSLDDDEAQRLWFAATVED